MWHHVEVGGKFSIDFGGLRVGLWVHWQCDLETKLALVSLQKLLCLHRTLETIWSYCIWSVR